MKIGIKKIILLSAYLIVVDAVNASTIDNCNEVHPLEDLKKIFDRVSGKHKIDCEKNASGAWFYKMSTIRPNGNDLGIETKIKLPEIIKDNDRVYHNQSDNSDYKNGPLDRPSIYLGGKIGGAELDAGLTWDKIHDENPKEGEEFAFRPFWRNTENGIDEPTEWHNPPVKSKNKTTNSCPEKKIEPNCSEKNTYFYPKDNIVMKIEELPIKGNQSKSMMKMVIKSQNGNKCFSVCFPQKKNPKAKGNTWKRVNSIDQFTLGPCYKNIDRKGFNKNCRVGNENKTVLRTKALSLETHWQEVNILNSKGNYPLVPDKDAKITVGKEFCDKFTGLKKRDHFRDSTIDTKGGQVISIFPITPRK
jgi:hypothetical protein